MVTHTWGKLVICHLLHIDATNIMAIEFPISLPAPPTKSLPYWDICSVDVKWEKRTRLQPLHFQDWLSPLRDGAAAIHVLELRVTPIKGSLPTYGMKRYLGTLCHTEKQPQGRRSG